MAYGPDGKTVLTGSWGKTARLWDAASGRPLGPALRHQAGAEGRGLRPGWQDRPDRQLRPDRPARDALRIALGPPLRHQGEDLRRDLQPGRAYRDERERGRDGRFWDVATAKPLGPALQHQGYVDAHSTAPAGLLP